MLRVVRDTNVVISALLRPAGLEDRIFKLALAGSLQLCVSPAILAEYAEVLPRPKFKLEPADIELTLAKIREGASIVHPTRILKISSDAADNRFLECAETAVADYLVTGNARHFPGAHKKTMVVTSRELLDILGTESCR
jgi:putative PIN family toxin of toxin-antitoxin system